MTRSLPRYRLRTIAHEDPELKQALDKYGFNAAFGGAWRDEERVTHTGGSLRAFVLAINPVYAAMLAHYGAVADAARVADPNRKGTVENAIQHTQSTALKGRKFARIRPPQRLIVSSYIGYRTRSPGTWAPPDGIMFDNLDGLLFYDPLTFYGQSKLAVALYAKELSRRLRRRAIAVNSLHSGASKGSGARKDLFLPLQVVRSMVQLFMKSVGQRAATGALLAASPCVTGITGEYWSDCQVAEAIHY